MSRYRYVIVATITVVAAVLFGAGLWMQRRPDSLLMQTQARPLIMSTLQFNLTVVVPSNMAGQMDEIFDGAENAARLVEREMNIYNPASVLSQFNAAPAGKLVRLPRDVVYMLRESVSLCGKTKGAFDVTIGPLIGLWKQCEKQNRLPSQAELLAARNASRWTFIEINDDAAAKEVSTVSVDLGGIAKGYAIDLAVAAMIRSGCVGGIVDIGGDVRCFGHKPGFEPWGIAVANPFAPDQAEPLVVLDIVEGAVCTSGNYRRYRRIQGRYFSRIIDPMTGWPADKYPSVTVYAPTAACADTWATALSVLGPGGFELIPADSGIEAMVVTGTEGDFEKHMTAGFAKLLRKGS